MERGPGVPGGRERRARRRDRARRRARDRADRRRPVQRRERASRGECRQHDAPDRALRARREAGRTSAATRSGRTRARSAWSSSPRAATHVPAVPDEPERQARKQMADWRRRRRARPPRPTSSWGRTSESRRGKLRPSSSRRSHEALRQRDGAEPAPRPHLPRREGHRPCPIEQVDIGKAENRQADVPGEEPAGWRARARARRRHLHRRERRDLPLLRRDCSRTRRCSAPTRRTARSSRCGSGAWSSSCSAT